MKLEGDLFVITHLLTKAETLFATLEINATNRIFEGHFPGQPILPGVCQMQIIKELTEKITGKKIRLKKADSIKFLNVINPAEHNTIDAELSYKHDEDGNVYVTATMTVKETVCFKFKGLFII